MDRRDFLKTTATAAVLAGPAVIGARGANDKINIGWIGVGTRGNAGIDWLKKAAPDTVTITAICDTFQGYLARGKDRVQTIWGNTPATYEDYHDLLANKSIDAVFIMTPEHLHHDMAIAALRAGKHVYLEKPLAHTIEEGFDIVREWKKSGKIVQVGTQNRSSSLYKKAKEMVKQGMIGDVHFVRAFWYRNSTDDNPAWRYVIPPDANQQNTDWAKFLGPAPKRAWDPHRYYQWRLYWDYSGGISTDLLVHQTDIVNFMLDRTAAALLHGVGRHLPLDRRGRRPRYSRHFQRDLRIPRQTPDQLFQLFRQRSIRLRRAVVRQRRHPRSAEPQGPLLHAAVARTAKRRTG